MSWHVGGAAATHRMRMTIGALTTLIVALAGPSHAEAAGCFPVAQGPARVMPAAFAETETVRLTFLGHSSFLIESAGGATAVTDYNGIVRAGAAPDVVTMNNAHSTHFTDSVEAGVRFVLRGWDPSGGMAQHDLTYLDMHVRNVATNVRAFGGTRYNGNSIFVFEIGELCIAHLGHLHHLLTDVHLGELGVIDVLLVPIDGGYTMSHEIAVAVIEQIGAPLVIPMHYFNRAVLSRFVELLPRRYEVAFNDTPTVSLSRHSLPFNKFLVLPGN